MIKWNSLYNSLNHLLEVVQDWCRSIFRIEVTEPYQTVGRIRRARGPACSQSLHIFHLIPIWNFISSKSLFARLCLLNFMAIKFNSFPRFQFYIFFQVFAYLLSITSFTYLACPFDDKATHFVNYYDVPLKYVNNCKNYLVWNK